MNLPNKLTLLRIALVPVFIACFFVPISWTHLLAAIVFLIAYATDIMDGRYARSHNIVTTFGKLMDPMADKLLMSAAFIMLVQEGLVSAVVAIIIIGREFIISAFRMVAVGTGNVIAANWLGKTKTVTQCIAVAMLLLLQTMEQLFGSGLIFAVYHVATYGLLYLSVLFAVWSALDYILKNKSSIRFD